MEDEPPVYLYARHKWNAASFVEALDGFLLEHFKEWNGRSFPVVLNRDGKRLELDLTMPFGIAVPGIEAVRFAKFVFPFGPITIEFGMTRVSENDLKELERNRLPRSLETPLIGCEVTNTDLPLSLVARGHWASEMIPPEVLVSLLRQAAPAFAI
ncbi:MAG: hypothetical protein ACRD7E_09920 [Bryobacteraceae bacterium]